MTDLLDRAFEAVRRMPAAEQDTIAEAMLSLAGIDRSLDIEPEHRAAVIEGKAQAAQGAFAEGDAGAVVALAFGRARA